MSYGQKKHANAILRSRYEEMMSGKAEYEKVRPAATARALNRANCSASSPRSAATRNNR